MIILRSNSSDEELQSLLQSSSSDKDGDAATTALLGNGVSRGKRLALDSPKVDRRFFFQRPKNRNDPEAIATQPSVFDDPAKLQEYRPPDEWENVHRLDPDVRWTWREEYTLIRKIDGRIMTFAALMFMALELDRSNIYQALMDHLLGDLSMTTNNMSGRRLQIEDSSDGSRDYNLGTTVSKFAFLCAEVPSQLITKWVGPDIWIPSRMIVWSLVGSSQYYLKDRTSFLVSRPCLGMLQGDFISEVCLQPRTERVHSDEARRYSLFRTSTNTTSSRCGSPFVDRLSLCRRSGWVSYFWYSETA